MLEQVRIPVHHAQHSSPLGRFEIDACDSSNNHQLQTKFLAETLVPLYARGLLDFHAVWTKNMLFELSFSLSAQCGPLVSQHV